MRNPQHFAPRAYVHHERLLPKDNGLLGGRETCSSTAENFHKRPRSNALYCTVARLLDFSFPLFICISVLALTCFLSRWMLKTDGSVGPPTSMPCVPPRQPPSGAHPRTTTSNGRTLRPPSTSSSGRTTSSPARRTYTKQDIQHASTIKQ